MYTLDTNVLIYHLHGDPSVRRFMNEIARTTTLPYISVVTITELFKYPKLSAEEEFEIEKLLPIFSIIPLDSQVARRAGELGRFYNLKLADSIIAATALFTGSILLTRNARDFRRVPSLAL